MYLLLFLTVAALVTWIAFSDNNPSFTDMCRDRVNAPSSCQFVDEETCESHYYEYKNTLYHCTVVKGEGCRPLNKNSQRRQCVYGDGQRVVETLPRGEMISDHGNLRSCHPFAGFVCPEGSACVRSPFPNDGSTHRCIKPCSTDLDCGSDHMICASYLSKGGAGMCIDRCDGECHSSGLVCSSSASIRRIDFPRHIDLSMMCLPSWVQSA